MKIIKNTLTLCAVLAFVFSLSASADAQKRRTTKKRAANNAARANVNATPAANAAKTAEIKDGARKVSDQLKNVTKFTYLLGGIAGGIEQIDKESKTKKLSQSALSLNDENKKKVIRSIRDLRAGLAALEAEFTTKNSLRLYNFQIQGVTDMSGRAEDLALSGQFTESGKMLLAVVEKLSDTLVSLP